MINAAYNKIRQAWRAVRRRRKDLQLQIAKLILDRRAHGKPFKPADLRKIALFRWDDKIGDCLMATLFVNAVKQARPDIHITFITGQHGAELLAGFADLDELKICGKRSWATAWQLRRMHDTFDLVVEPGSGISALELYALSGLKTQHVMGFGKADYAMFDVPIPELAK